MKLIPLRNCTLFALVDDEDYERFLPFDWYFHGTNIGGYAARTVQTDNGGRAVFMHREILNPPEGFKTDHRDLNKLNNQRDNLRIASNSQNGANYPKRMGCSSRFKGVTRRGKKWQANYRKDGVLFYLGLFIGEIEAAKAYDKAVIDAFGEFARTNF